MEENEVKSRFAEVYAPLFEGGMKEIIEQLGSIEHQNKRIIALGEILTLHITIEKYLVDFLLLKYPDLSLVNIEKSKFSDKIKIIRKSSDFAQNVIDALDSFNTVRNGFAHKVGFEKIGDDHKRKFQAFLVRWSKGDKKFDVIKFEEHLSRDFRLMTYFLLLEVLAVVSLVKTHKEVSKEIEAKNTELFDSFMGSISDA